jgi:hypothetical protein
VHKVCSAVMTAALGLMLAVCCIVMYTTHVVGHTEMYVGCCPCITQPGEMLLHEIVCNMHVVVVGQAEWAVPLRGVECSTPCSMVSSAFGLSVQHGGC